MCFMTACRTQNVVQDKTCNAATRRPSGICVCWIVQRIAFSFCMTLIYRSLTAVGASFFLRWDISVVCPVIILKLAVTVFTFKPTLSDFMTELINCFSAISGRMYASELEGCEFDSRPLSESPKRSLGVRAFPQLPRWKTFRFHPAASCR